MRARGWLLAGLLLALAVPVAGQNLAEFEKSVTEHTLANGMKFIIVERHTVPVVSLFLHADVGSVNDTSGNSGVAHLFEHMAFKGTSDIGTKDIAKERAALAHVDETYHAWADRKSVV